MHREMTTHSPILNILYECVKHFYHPPSQTPAVAYFLSGLPGKNDYVCTSLTTHVFSYVCALTHFPPLPPMTNCGSAYSLPGRDSKNTQRISYTYYHTVINKLHECVKHSFLNLSHQLLWGGLLPTRVSR